ncbi:MULTISPECIES: TetR family transcriptional regulator [Saccharomonospora]|uniref:Transcriptional regulator n=1 Tax=Saccharomonospora glauca K62 TaxID=928724 RepID=I1D6P8_9PSEU|nr:MULTISPECIES: TetR family transcriptional regulator [Saccharomonospora]EIF00623.1 transcriptional regulator [Saccharomonospora glauca K62]
MAQITNHADRVRASLREQLLDATTELLTESGYAGLRMADVAAAVGVSRQTVYNEFGNKAALVQAVVLRILGEVTEGIRHRLDEAGDVLTGVHAATVYTVEHARRNRLVAAVMGARPAEDLLPLITTRGQPVLHAATDLAEAYLREQLPDLADPRFVATTMARLTLSHLVLPHGSATDAADHVRTVVAALLRPDTTFPPSISTARDRRDRNHDRDTGRAP